MYKLFFLFFCLFFVNCSSFELVYKNIEIDSALKNNTRIMASGDLSESALTHLTNFLGSKDGNEGYRLEINIVKSKKKLVVTTGSIATKYRVSLSVSYTLYNNDLKCKIFSISKKTLTDFDSRADGYSFGTDTAERDSELVNLKSNINSFFSSLNMYNYNLDCVNED